MNLLEDILTACTAKKKTPEDIIYVGARDGSYSCTWDQFQQIAEKIVYSNDSMRGYTAHDLIIIFADNSWLERCAYNDWGGDWWHYFQPLPVKQGKQLVAAATMKEY